MKTLFLLTFLITVISCGTSDDDQNPVLPNIPVNVTLNLDLPLYQNLQFDSSSAFVENHGIKGIIVFRISENNILAWEAACPHIAPSECSTMNLVGVEITCPCDDSKFSILNGGPLSGTQFSMKQYRATKNGNTITITNF